MSNPINTTLLIVGGGPGGYVAAIRAGQLGIPTVLVEGASLGGTCLNIGCIPSKALIHVAEQFHAVQGYAGESALGIRVQAPELDLARSVAWKDAIVKKLTGGIGALLKKHKITVVHGWAHIIDGKTVDVDPLVKGKEGAPQRIRCEHLLLATGSEPAALPFMPFGGPVISSTEALSPRELPKSLAIVGAGYIGLELGTVYRKLGVKVDVVEAQDRILPAYDAELTKPVLASLKSLGMSLHLQTQVLGLADDGKGLRIQPPKGDERVLAAQQVLVAVGRRPRSRGFGLSSLMLDMDGLAVRVDDRCRTSMNGVWAIGDLTGEPMLAHRAMAQGECVAEQIAGQTRRFVPAAIPAVCFTDPEVVTAGLSPQQAAAAGIDALDGTFPLAANGRAMTLESTDGFVRVVARRDNHLIIGWQAVGRGVSEFAAAFGQSLEMGARLEDVGHTIHAHPTQGEAIQEAALRALGQAIHT
ncbi:dihydrolipoyl dehydrogenase [Castellaniella caeni]|uniref:dihydrolipoyl dehydrogenase n=3 Tax=Castellaniella caeni TaxID=266123 RepID=UPI0008298201|nr:dihydrolipoyl dehydrogenase [Castellaniella caeni]